MRKNIGEAVALTTVAAVIGIGAVTYEKAQDLKASLDAKIGFDTGRINPLMHKAAINVGKKALAIAEADGNPQEIQPDKGVKDGITISLTAQDGNKTFVLIADMLTKKDGEPDPSTTYEAIIGEYRADSTMINETAVFGGRALDGQNWDGSYKTFSESDQKHPKVNADTYRDQSLKEAQDIAGILKLESGIISILPSAGEPKNTITV